jgi:FkbM family methyltransferase
MTMISYAQNAEDVLLNRLFPEGYRGFYIDIGAAHPTVHSVTRHFYNRGWRGINVEPVPAFFDLIKSERPRDVNLRRAISDRPGVLTLYHAESSEGESTLSPVEAEALRARGLSLDTFEVEAITLRGLCETHVPEATEIDFLKIDVEHHEDAVIRGADWSRWRPRVLVIEADKDTSWEASLLESGYLYATHDGINRYYVRDEDGALLPPLMSPANCLDHYIPYEHLAPRLEAEARLRATEAHLGATNEALKSSDSHCRASQAELHAARAEVAARQDDLGRSRAEVGSLSAQLQGLAGDLAAERRRNEQMVEHLREVTSILAAERQRCEGVTEAYYTLIDRVTLDDGLLPGPALIALANRLRDLAGKYPRMVGRAKRMLKVAQP